MENKDKNNQHEAIRVTDIKVKSISTTDDKNNSKLISLYKLIWKNSIESCMSPAEFSCTTIKISAPMKCHYASTVETPLFLGWKILDYKGDFVQDQASTTAELFKIKTMEATKSPIISPIIINSVCVARNTHSHYSEATLIKKLEDLEIGRPSTFATIVDTIQERDYVKKMDIAGKTQKCNEYRLEGQILVTIPQNRVFGNEKSRLVIQPLGILAIEFLTLHFGDFFSYDYTKKMEADLDRIANKDTVDNKENSLPRICNTCLDDIMTAIKPLEKIKKQSWHIDDIWTASFQRFGLTLSRTLEDGTIEFKPIRKDIEVDLNRLERGEYNIDDLIQNADHGFLGEFDNEKVYLKTGKFGPYVKWGENTKSIKELKKPFQEITITDILPLLTSEQDQPNAANKSILRTLRDDLSIRNGKYGPYIFHQSTTMSKPKFLNLKTFDKGFKTCETQELLDWIWKTHGI